MKVLWLTNNACSALELLEPTNSRGGWLVSLEKELSHHDEIDLHVGFYHKTYIVPFRHDQTTFYPLGRNYSKNKVTRYIGRIFSSQHNDQKEIKIIKSLIDKLQPDIIHVHGTEENFGLIQGHTRIPIVISIQGLLNPCLEKFFSGIPSHITRRYESLVDKLAFRTARSSYRKLKKGTDRERVILKNAQYIIGRTGWDRAITRLLSPGSTYFEGQEMLRPSFNAKTRHKTPLNRTIKLLTVSGNSLYKGFEMIVKTSKLLKEFPDFDFVWLVAGVDRNSYSVRIVMKWLNVDLEKIGIRLLGNQTEPQLADLLTNSHIFCQVSHIENSSNSLCEAMMIGLPIIATNVGGTNSLLESKKEGLLIQEGDSYALAGAIIETNNNMKNKISQAKKAKQRAVYRHNKQAIVNELISNYNNIKQSSI